LDHIGFYINIRQHFIKAGHQVDNITIINALLSLLPHTPTWNVVKQTLLQQGQKLTLKMVTTELTMVYNYITQENIAEGTDKQFRTLVMFFQSRSFSQNRGRNNNSSV